MNICIITIGDELLIGQVIDTNSAWLAKKLNKIGVQVDKILTISDSILDIKDAINKTFEKYDWVITTGGLGPTKDDITKNAIIDVFADDLVFNEDMYERLKYLFAKRGRQTTEAHRRQCYLPSKAMLFPNELGTAPGMCIQEGNKNLISLPGVPYEMKFIFENSVISFLKKFNITNEYLVHKTILTAGEGETKLNEKFQDIEKALPRHIKIAFLPGLAKVRIRITAKGTDEEHLEQELEHWKNKIVARIKGSVYGFDEEILESIIGSLCKARGFTIATAESCTGGSIAHKITSIAGSSAYFLGSVVAYSNVWKENFLKVPQETLKHYGAVSEQTVVAMLMGLVEETSAHAGIAISGIAGPGGGTPEKPVGTIWIACGGRKLYLTERLQLTRDRKHNIEYAATYALNMLRKFLTEQ